MYLRRKTLKGRGAPTRRGTRQSGRPSRAVLKTRALSQEQLEGFDMGSNRKRFAVGRREERGVDKSGFRRAPVGDITGPRGLCLRPGLSLRNRENSAGVRVTEKSMCLRPGPVRKSYLNGFYQLKKMSMSFNVKRKC